MSYITLEYVQARVKDSDLVAMSCDEGETTYSSTRIAAIITDAEAEFDNAAIQAGYTVPVTTQSDFVKRLIFDVFLYYLYARKYDDEEMKDVFVRYNKAMSKLAKIASGEITLNAVAPTSGISATDLILSNKHRHDKVFHKHELEII